jgi:hypothetical protein
MSVEYSAGQKPEQKAFPHRTSAPEWVMWVLRPSGLSFDCSPHACPAE